MTDTNDRTFSYINQSVSVNKLYRRLESN